MGAKSSRHSNKNPLEAEAAALFNEAAGDYKASRHNQALDKFKRALAMEEQLGRERRQAACMSYIGSVLKSQGKLEEALEHYQRSLAIKERLAPDSLDVAISLNNIGSVLDSQGKLEEALEHYQRSLPIMQRLAPDSLSLATSLNNIGSVLDSQGKLEEALEYHQRSLAIRQRLAPDSLSLATSLNNIGLALQSQGKLEEALEYYQRSLAIKERLAPDSLSLATSLNNIGGVLQSQGKLAEALEYYQRSLAIRERLAPDSLDVAISLNNIGGVLRSQGKLEEALEHYQRSLPIMQRLAPDSLDVALSLNNIGGVLKSQGKLAEALEYHQRSLAIRERLAPDSLSLATSLNNIGAALYSKGKLAEAASYFQRSLAIRQRLAPDSLDVAASLNNIGSVLNSQGKLEQALGYFQRSLAIRERLAPDSLDVAISLNNIGLVLKSQGKLAEALEYHQRSLAIMQRLAPDSLDVATSLNNIGSVLDSQGKLAEALEYYQRSLAIRQRLAPDSLDVAMSLNNIGSVLDSQGKLEEALGYYQRSLPIMQRLAPDSLSLATSLNNIGSLLRSQQKLDESLPYFQRAYDIMLRPEINILPTHPDLIDSTKTLAEVHLELGNHQQALQLANEIIAKLPEYKWAQLIKAKAWLGLERFDAAIDSYDAALNLDPNYADAHTGRLEALLAQDKYQAEQAAKAAEELTRVTQQHQVNKARLEAAFAAAQQVDFEASKQYDARVKATLEAEARKADPKAPPKVELPEPEVKDRPQYERRLSKIWEEIENLKQENQQLKAVQVVQGERIDAVEIRVTRLEERMDVFEGRLVTIDDTMAILTTAHEQSAIEKAKDEELRNRIIRFSKTQNLKEYFEAMQTEIAAKCSAACVLSSGQVAGKDPKLPAALAMASTAAALIALAPVPGANTISGIVNAGGNLYKSYARFKQGQELRRLASLTTAPDFQGIVLRLSLHYTEKFANQIQSLPILNPNEQQSLMSNIWANICSQAQSNIKTACLNTCQSALTESNGVLTRIPLPNIDISKLSSNASKMFNDGKQFIFGVAEGVITGKPQSPAALLGKVHAADIVSLLLTKDLDEVIRYSEPRPETMQRSVSAGFAQILQHQQVALVFSPQATPGKSQPPTVAPEEELPPPRRGRRCLIM